MLIGYAVLAIIGWVQIGMPNPQGLGDVSKALEVALIVALVAHAARGFGGGASVARMA